MGLSPMMQHYLEVKEQHKDCVVFYRLGDFYEMFFEDAKRVSEMLDLTLTGRDCGLAERAPMCGIPFHAADGYIQKLVSLGEKVAICEQLTEPNGKELVRRDVVKIVTAGTLDNETLIDEKTNNFICSVYLNAENCACAWADITTGEFFARSFSGDKYFLELTDLLVRIDPAEIIATVQASDIFNKIPLIIHGVLPKFSAYTESEFSYSNAKQTLLKHFNVLSLASFGIENDKNVISASGSLIAYLYETQKHALSNINSITLENSKDLMMLDINAIRNLELVKTNRDGKRYGSLLWVLDKTKTSMGARKLQSWILSPLCNKEQIEYRLNGVESLFNNALVRQGLVNTLTGVRDIGRISGKISNGNLMPRDCLALANSLEVLPNITFQLLGTNAKIINDICDKIKDFSDIVKLINSAISEDCPPTMKDGGYIKKGYSAELDELKDLRDNSRGIIATIEKRERERTGVKTLKVGYNKVFGYYIELTNSVKDQAPYDYIRKQTLVGSERYITEELKQLEEKVITAEEKSLRLESEIFKGIKEKLFARLDDLLDTADAVSDLDVLLSFAVVAKENNFCRPSINEGSALNITGGRHPVVEKMGQFVPNDCTLDGGENRMMIITGPNMAGKSTYMRQVALITLMAHIGCFVPASKADIPLTDKIFTRIGASDNLISDQSTFMVEMTEIATILANATKDSLIVLDEIGRGTSTFDGLSIAWAIVEYVTDVIKAKTMFATHYHELTELEGRLEGVKNYKVTVKEYNGSIVFLRKIMRGGANRSFGIEVSCLAGIRKEVTDRAKEILRSLEKSDITVRKDDKQEEREYSEIEEIIKETDINNISPMQAFAILQDLKEKLEK